MCRPLHCERMPGVRDSIRIFLENSPSPVELWRSRRSTFERAHCILPSTAVVGESFDATVQARDRYERLVPDFEGEFTLGATDPEAAHPETVALDATEEGVTSTGEVRFETPGVHYLTVAHEPTDRRFVSNPVEVHAEEPEYRRYWGDIHLHSKYSDGSGSMRKGFAFGRDVMDLDVVAYTDHDTMGFFIPPRLQRRIMRRRNFDAMKRVTEEFNDPGSFVTLFGYEWTKQPNQGGHINVYFDDPDRAELFDSISPRSNTYEKLWTRLHEWKERTGGDVLAFPHHPAEAMYPFDFSETDYDDELAPLVEVYSQWASSEMPGREGNPKPVAMGQGEVDESGHYAQDALRMGHRVGLMCSADYHGPHPGHSLIHADPHLPRLGDIIEDGFRWGYIWRIWNEQSYPGGLVAFRAPELTREAVFESLKSRRVYGTTQPDRILVHFAVNGTRPGDDDSEAVVDAPDAERDVAFEVAGTAPLARVTVVKNNADWHVVEGADDSSTDPYASPHADLDAYTVEETVTDDAPVEGMAWDDQRGTDADVYYLRARQTDGGMAWAGPVWVAVE